MNEQKSSSQSLKYQMDLMRPGQVHEPNTYYQILLVTPPKKRTEGKYITTTIVAKSKGEFDECLLDQSTKEKLQHYYKDYNINGNSVGSYLPSPGVVLSKGFVDDLFSQSDTSHKIINEANNFYDSILNLLQSRKISQLISTTWHFYLEAKKTTGWDDFVKGEWDKIDAPMLNALIAREMFFVNQSNSPSELDPPDINVYYPLGSVFESSQNPRFMILPNSNAWQGIALSLLMAGQAYREIKESDGITYYHQISQPILSTGEIVNRYGMEVEWHGYEGKIKELNVSPGGSSTAFQVVVPYPPIPSEINLSSEHIKKWAEADDEGEDFPFYSKAEDGEYSIYVNHVTPPYPYLPLTST